MANSKNCQHLNSGCINSRPRGVHGAIVASFPYMIYRRRKCKDCGERFNTFELTIEQMKSMGRDDILRYIAEIERISAECAQKLRSII